MGWIRNRVAQMGVNPAYVHEDMPYFHMWMQVFSPLDVSSARREISILPNFL